MHDVTPATLYVPAPQLVQAVAAVARFAFVPAAHNVQPVDPDALAYFPASHDTQTDEAGTDV